MLLFTNSFNSVNYAAIPHSEKHRKAFKPQNDFFVEFDFDGYHLRLLCEQIGYPLTNESAHKQLAKLYFNKDEIKGLFSLVDINLDICSFTLLLFSPNKIN